MTSDEELYRQACSGNRESFRALYDRHADRLFGFLRGYVESREEAEDLLHTTFLRVLQSREVTLNRASFRTWLYRIGRNLALNELRSSARASAAIRRAPETPLQPGSDELHEAKARLHAVADAVERLPTALAEVFQLRARGLSYAEMAEVLEIPLGTCKSRMHEMLTQLREEMTSWTP